MTEAERRGRAARNKGAVAERELANLLRDMYGCPTHRGKVFYGESDVVGLDGIHIEAKRVERLNIHQAMAQAISEAQKRQDGLPAVFHRRNRGEWLVTMRLTDLIDLYGEWHG